MEVRLLITHGKANLKQVVLGPETIIGRGNDCNLKIASSQVSRRHCRIVVTDSEVHIRDLGSANGTLVNGKPLPKEEDTPVAPGAVLVVGPLKFVVQFTPPVAVVSVSAKARANEVTTRAPDDTAVQVVAAPPPGEEDTRDLAPAQKMAAVTDEPDTALDLNPAEDTRHRDSETKAAQTTEDDGTGTEIGTALLFPEDQPADADESAGPAARDPDQTDMLSAEDLAAAQARVAPPAAEPPRKKWGLFDFFRRKKSSAESETIAAIRTPGVAPSPAKGSGVPETPEPLAVPDADEEPDFFGPLEDDAPPEGATLMFNAAAEDADPPGPSPKKKSKNRKQDEGGDDSLNAFLKNL